MINKIKLMHFNVRGLQPKRREVKALLDKEMIDIAVISESHAKSDTDITV